MDGQMRRAFSELFCRTRAYDFQLTTARRLLDGHNVVLQAPTGAGKTFGAIFPFVYAKLQGLPFADRLIYALPQRTLAVALYEQTRSVVTAAPRKINVKIQTGAMPEDSFFQADVVFTTIDQLLSAYIGVPVSLPRKTANLPAGAILGAYVVFDEFHLLEPGRALATALDLAHRLSRYTRLLLMSATVPDQSLRELACRTKAEIVQVTDDEVQQIPSQRGKVRRLIWRDRPLAASDVLDGHDNRSIVVVNRVERAQQLFKDLRQLAHERGVTDTLLLLHARFLPDDRKAIENRILEHFKKGGTGRAILIATQVIEVGLDISSKVMHTELAPANSIFQRAGRCARYAEETGTVYVYALPLNQQGTAIYGPYLEEEQALVDETGRQLAMYSGQTIGFTEEKAIVDAVHAETDLKLLCAVAPVQRRADVEEAMRTGKPEYVRRLIREVDSVNVIIHDHPDTLRLDRRPQTFSVSRSAMQGFLNDLDLAGTDAGSVRMLVFDDESQGESSGVKEWRAIHWAGEAKGAVYLVVAPTHAHYDAALGLQLGRQAQASAFRSQESSPRHDAGFDPYSYTRETYEAHVKLVIRQHEAQEPSCCIAATRLAAAFGLSKGDLDDLSRLVAALHDTGKLAEAWQQAIWRWQKEVHKELRLGFLAHSQFDGTDPDQRKMQRNPCYKKPPHAVEGAYAAFPILAEEVKKMKVTDQDVETVTYALASAIARHHSAFSENLSAFTLSGEARAEALRVASHSGDGRELWDHPTLSERATFAKSLVTPQSGDAFLLYWYVARRLRIADQQATSMAGGCS